MLFKYKISTNSCVILFIVSVIILMIQGCSDLSVTPEDRYTPKNFYNNANDANAAIVAVYDRLYDADGGRWPISLNGLVSDNQYEPAYVPFARKHGLDEYNFSPENADLRRFYRAGYRLISRANIAINKIADIDMGSAKKKEYIGEAKFLRAFEYFFMEQNFGPVPLILGKKGDLMGDEHKGNTPMFEIDAQIVSDLNYAIENLPESNSSGRATKGAARALLARVYLAWASYQKNNVYQNVYPNRKYHEDSQAYYKKARDMAKDVIDAGNYSLFKDYKDNFRIATENGNEQIFSFQYSQQTQANLYNFFSLPPECGLTPADAEGEFISTIDIYNAYEDGDYRRDVNLIAECTTPDGEHLTYKDWAAPVPHIFTFYPLSGKSSGPVSDPIAQRDLNVPIIRYAEVLLIYAEALNELGQPGAYKYVNMINKRARHGDPNAPPQDVKPGSLTQDQFEKMIYKVRRLEFPFEGLRKYDIDRSGRMKEILCKPKAPFVNAGCANITDTDVLFPIPARELQLNPALKQNPGY